MNNNGSIIDINNKPLTLSIIHFSKIEHFQPLNVCIDVQNNDHTYNVRCDSYYLYKRR